MLVKLIQDAIRNWGAPADWKPENGVCGGLPTALRDGPGGIQYWVSAWEPTPEELAQLNAGGSIHLWISANQHPVVAMSVNPPVDGEGR